MNRKRGLTLLELLVSIAIIGVLVSLLIPAVQAARETARRIVCTSNARQIAFACQNYHLAHNSFPPERFSAPNISWSIFILPYVEQLSLYEEYDRNKSWDHLDNQRVVGTQLAIFQCPSTPNSGRRWDRFGSNLKAASGDYAPHSRVTQGLVLAGFVEERSSLRGLIIPLRGSNSNEALDGLSNTIMFAEDAGRPSLYLGRKLGPDSHSDGKNSPVFAGRVRGAGWADHGSGIPLDGVSKDGNTSHGPCAINCTNNNEAYSFHIGGIHVSLGDGATRFLSDSVSIEIYASLITAQGNDLASLE